MDERKQDSNRNYSDIINNNNQVHHTMYINIIYIRIS